MPDGFNMVTAMETIHRHIHAVGCGALPSCWMTGDPSFFCRADGLFVPSLAVWFGAACRRPFGDGSWDGYLPPMPRGSMWGVRDHRAGDGWRRYISYGSHGVVSDVMEIMEAGGGKREVRFFFRRDAEALLGALWCLDMMGHVGFMPFDPQVCMLHMMKYGDWMSLDGSVCVSDTFYFVDDVDVGYGVLWHGRNEYGPTSRVGVTEMNASAIRKHPHYEDISLPLSIRTPRCSPGTKPRPGSVIAEMAFTVPLHAAAGRKEADLWSIL